MGALFYVDEFRDRIGARRIASFGHWGETFEVLDLPRLDDIHRVFTTAATYNADDSVLLLEHTLPDATLRVAFENARTKHAGQPIQFPFPKALIEIDKALYLFAAPRRGLLVLMPFKWSAEASKLVEAGNLPEPVPREAARFFAFSPLETLAATPAWPPTIVAAQAVIRFDALAADVDFEAWSGGEEQATVDAEVMERTVDDLLNLKLGPIRLPLFDPVHFAPDGRLVRMKARLQPEDVSWILGFSG